MNIRKIINLLLSSTLILSFAFFTSCDDDDDEPVSPLVGTYAFASASAAQDYSVVITGNDTITNIPNGETQITSLIVSGGLFSQSGCDNPQNSRIELRADGTSWIVCDGETGNDVQQGTWTFDDTANELELNVTNTSTGSPILVLISNVDLLGTALSGTIENFPSGLDLNFQLGVQLSSGPFAGSTNFQTIMIDVGFIKTN